MDSNTDEKLIIYGRNPVKEYLLSEKSAEVFYTSLDDDNSLTGYYISLAKSKGATVKKVKKEKLNFICGSEHHQGVAVLASSQDYCDLDDIFDLAQQKNEAPFIIIADGIEDPHNLGAIIRTSECAGVHGLIIPERRGCLVNSTVYKASAGACSHILIHKAKNIANTINELKNRGVFCYCTDADGDMFYETNLTGACAIVVGSEGRGVSELVRKRCDGTLSIPLKGSVNSLNAAVAAGIVIYEVIRQNMYKR